MSTFQPTSTRTTYVVVQILQETWVEPRNFTYSLLMQLLSMVSTSQRQRAEPEFSVFFPLPIVRAAFQLRLFFSNFLRPQANETQHLSVVSIINAPARNTNIWEDCKQSRHHHKASIDYSKLWKVLIRSPHRNSACFKMSWHRTYQQTALSEHFGMR